MDCRSLFKRVTNVKRCEWQFCLSTVSCFSATQTSTGKSHIASTVFSTIKMVTLPLSREELRIEDWLTQVESGQERPAAPGEGLGRPTLQKSSKAMDIFSELSFNIHGKFHYWAEVFVY